MEVFAFVISALGGVASAIILIVLEADADSAPQQAAAAAAIAGVIALAPYVVARSISGIFRSQQIARLLAAAAPLRSPSMADTPERVAPVPGELGR